MRGARAGATAWGWPLLVALVLGCSSPPGEADSGKSADGASPGSDAVAFNPLANPWIGVEAGATARYDLTATDWHAQPFPTDSRRAGDGSLDLTGFPESRDPGIDGILTQYLDFASKSLKGWSIQPTVYVQFDAPLDAKNLVAVAETIGADSPYLLVDVDPTSPEYGQRLPVVARITPTKRAQFLFNNMLMVQPAWGRPLRALTTYALVVRRGLRGADGHILGRPLALANVLDDAAEMGTMRGFSSKEVALGAALQPLVKAIQAGKVEVPFQDIGAATVFTTGNPIGALVAMAEWVRTKAPVQPATKWKKLVANDPDYQLLEAEYLGPDFQSGKCPYNEQGSGGFLFDGAGNPIVQKLAPMRVAVAVPKDHRLYLDGRPPVVLSAHGTGGDYLSFIDGGKNRIGTELTARGMAVISIDQPLHGPRCDPEISGDELDLKTFNYLNISAGRSGFQQSALDTVFLTRMVREGMLDVPESVGPNGLPVHFDTIRLAFIGHSQGGISGALVAAIEPALTTYVLSGAGAGLSLTIMLRKVPQDIAETLSGLLSLDAKELSEFHPIVSLVQMLSDVTDPLSYAPHVLERPGEVRPPHVLLTEGLLDEDTPSVTAEALAAAMGLEILAPEVHMNDAMLVAKTRVLPAPVQNNLQRNGFGVTALLSQWKDFGHFAIFESAAAARMYAAFLESALESGEAVADPH